MEGKDPELSLNELIILYWEKGFKVREKEGAMIERVKKNLNIPLFVLFIHSIDNDFF